MNAPSFCTQCLDPSYCGANSTCLDTGADLVAARDTINSAGTEDTTKPGASLVAVYDLLAAGKKLHLQFRTDTEANSFRTALYRYKRRTTDQLASLDIDFDRMMLSWDSLSWHSSHKDGVGTIVAVQLREKKETAFTILSIEDANSSEETQVPSGVGKT